MHKVSSSKIPYRFVVISVVLFTFGLIFGSIYASKASSKELGEYFSSFFSSEKNISWDNFKLVILKNLIIWSIIAFSSSFAIGSLLNIFILAHRGFVTGYTLASLCKCFGANGMFFCGAMLPEMLLLIPTITFFSAISLKMSFSKHETRKFFLKNFLLILFLTFSIFCVVSLVQTFLTTIFMNLIFSKIIN